MGDQDEFGGPPAAQEPAVAPNLDQILQQNALLMQAMQQQMQNQQQQLQLLQQQIAAQKRDPDKLSKSEQRKAFQDLAKFEGKDWKE